MGGREPAGWGDWLSQLWSSDSSSGSGGTARTPSRTPLAQQHISSSRGPQLLQVGAEAMRMARDVVPQSHAVTVQSNLGPVTLTPGNAYSNNKMIVSVSTMSIYYTIDDRLYEWRTSDFIRDEYFNAISAGAQRAAWLIPLARAEMALVTGIFVPWYVLLGVSCGRIMWYYSQHKEDVASAIDNGGKALRALMKLREDNPVLFHVLMRQSLHDIVVEIPGSVSGEDIAFFVGRCIKGINELPQVTWPLVRRTVLIVAGLVTATHLPAITIHAGGAVIERRAEELERSLRAAGVTVSRGEAETIIRDALSKPTTEETLNELQMAARELVPSLQRLNEALSPVHDVH